MQRWEETPARLGQGCRVVTAAEAIECAVRSGDRVFVATACGKPRALVEALVAQA